MLGPLRLFVDGYQFPDVDEYWDANWPNVRAEVELPGQSWVKAAGAFVMTAELARFRDELRMVYEQLDGEAGLWTIEPELKVRLTAQPNGGLEVEISLTPNQMTQEHTFFVALDQSYLPPVINQINDILNRFPVRGEQD